MIKNKKINKKKSIKASKIDEFYENKESEVLVDGNINYNIVLNKSDINVNNNKFYISQLIKNKNNFVLYTRYGRVGQTPGVIGKKAYKDKESGIKAYDKLISSKKKKKYVEIFLEEDDEVVVDKKNKNKKEVKLNKEKEIIDLIELIFDKTLLKNNLKSLGYDEKKLPLGKLSEDTIIQGFNSLEKLETAIKNKNKSEIDLYNNLFFSLIPHDVGFKKLSDFKIKNLDQVQSENLKLVVIKNMKNSNELMSKGDLKSTKEKYDLLNAEISLLNSKDVIYKYISQALHTTNSHHKVTIDSIFKVERKGEVFEKNIGNLHLLWHGSIIPNFVGIITQGLRIAPKEAPHNGYLYGKGIYMADCSNLSLNFSRAYNGETGLILLVETSLGKQSTYSGFKKGSHNSVFQGTKLQCKENLIDGAKLLHTPKSINYNMYISYNPQQVRIRYIIRYKAK